MASGPITSWQMDGEKLETVADFIFLGSKITADGYCSHEIERCLLSGRKDITNPLLLLSRFSRVRLCVTRQRIKKLRRHFADKDPYSQSYGFRNSHVQMWEINHKEGWVLKNWCFWTVVLEKTLQSPLESKEIKPVNPKWNQSWIFTGRTDTEAEAAILWLPDMKWWFTGKDSQACKDWRQEEKGATKDEMVGWHHKLNGYEFEQTPGDSEGQGSLMSSSPWGHKQWAPWGLNDLVSVQQKQL